MLPTTAPALSGRRDGGQSRASHDLGLSSVEYVVILVLVAAVSIGAWQAFGARALCAARDATGALAAIGTTAGAALDCSTEVGENELRQGSPPEARVKRKIH
jgi:hypothetical protein